MTKVSDMMADAHRSLAELSDKLRGAFHNENLADVVRAAADKCKQASEHPDAVHDVEAVHQAADSGDKIANPEAARLSGKPHEPPQPVSELKQSAPEPFAPGQQFPGQDASQHGSG